MITVMKCGTFTPGPGLLPFDIVVRDQGEDAHRRYVLHYRMINENGSISYNTGECEDDFREIIDAFNHRVLRSFRACGAPQYNFHSAK